MKNYRIVLAALFALGLVFSISGALIFGSFLFIDFLIRFYEKKNLSDLFTHHAIILIVCFCWGIGVSLWSHSINLLNAFSLQSSLFLVYIFAIGLEKDEIQSFLKWFSLGSIVMAVWGLVQLFCGVNYASTSTYVFKFSAFNSMPQNILRYLSVLNGRPVGTRSHPLTYAETLLPGFFLFLGYTFGNWEKASARRIKNVFSLLVLMIVLWYSQSRGVWLSITLGTIAFGMFQKRKIAIIAIAGIIAMNGIFFVSSPTIRGRFLSSFFRSQGQGGDQVSKQIRFELWKQSLHSIKKFPVFGVGLKGADFITTEEGYDRHWSESHNIYLQCAVDQGIVGLMLFLWLLLAIFLVILKLPEAWKGGCVGLFVAFLVSGLTESWMGDREIAMLFWTFIGFVFYVHRKRIDFHEES